MKIAVRIHNDEREAKICYTWEEIHDFFFSPIYDDKYIIPLQVHGKTYTEKKEDLRGQAIDFSLIFPTLENVYMSEILEIESFFRRNGKRYGLLTEFKENCIC